MMKNLFTFSILTKKNIFESKNEFGQTLLIWKAIIVSLDNVVDLLDYGADVNARSNDGETALIAMSKRCVTSSFASDHKDIIASLIKHGAYLYAKDNNGMTALMWAAAMGHMEYIGILLDAVKNVNNGYSYNNCDAALEMAEEYGRTDAIRLLRQRLLIMKGNKEEANDFLAAEEGLALAQYKIGKNI